MKALVRATFPEDIFTALSVADCESQFNITAVGPTQDYGLYQIHAPSWDKTAKSLGYGDYKTNPEHNVAMARYIYDLAGQNWTDWVCYTHKLIVMR